MGEESDRVEVPADAPFFARALDMETGLRHILAPAFFGALVGGLWQWKVMPQIGEINLPNPVHGAFLVSLVLSPLLYRILLDDEASRWREYTLGLASLGLLFSVIWLSGWGAMFCGGYGALLVWVWVSTDWGRYNLPPFRYGLWHAFGINLGALAGGIFAYTQFL
jgi:hypothetical protein